MDGKNAFLARITRSAPRSDLWSDSHLPDSRSDMWVCKLDSFVKVWPRRLWKSPSSSLTLVDLDTLFPETHPGLMSSSKQVGVMPTWDITTLQRDAILQDRQGCYSPSQTSVKQVSDPLIGKGIRLLLSKFTNAEFSQPNWHVADFGSSQCSYTKTRHGVWGWGDPRIKHFSYVWDAIAINRHPCIRKEIVNNWYAALSRLYFYTTFFL